MTKKVDPFSKFRQSVINLVNDQNVKGTTEENHNSYRSVQDPPTTSPITSSLVDKDLSPVKRKNDRSKFS
jgi:hypothetical protein